MGVVTGGGGGTFTGGTIAQPLTIHDHTSSVVDLTLIDAAARTDFTLGPGGETVIDPNATYSLTNDSLTLHTINQGGSHGLVILDGSAVSTWQIDQQGAVTATGDEFRGNSTLSSGGDAFFQGPSNRVSLTARVAASDNADIFQAVDHTAAVITRISHGGAIVTALHAAPADGDLVAGEMALWFDQTNGASKLMVKGKSANGTVVTGSVNLA